ncbi:MAG TPA: hypothetical protein VFZ25_15520 [Chloroflexota bacterium]|nr:hypothetical protein [Chloroflexota bacterium]
MTAEVHRAAIPSATLIRLAIVKGFQTATAGLVLGAVAGLLGLLAGGSAGSIEQFSVQIYPFMAIALPLALVLSTLAEVRCTLPRSVGVAGVARLALALCGVALVGTIVGTACFLTIRLYLPVVLTAFRLGSIELSYVELGEVHCSKILLALSTTLVVAIFEVVLARAGSARQGK